MRHRKTYIHINFEQKRVSRSVKTVRTNIFAKNCKLHTFATTNSIFVFYKNQLFQTCVIVNVHVCQFSAKSVSRSVKIVRTNIIAKNCKLHTFATTNSNFEKINSLRDMHHHKMYMYINFQQNRVNRSVITLHTNLFAKNCKLHKFATCN